jgi:hypothetical protein
MHSAFALLLISLSLSLPICAQSKVKKLPDLNRPPLLVRTTTRHELRRFPFGGTVTIIGAPEGSVTIEGWSRSEVDIIAEIQLRADTEADLDLLARVNTVVLDEDMNHLRVLTTGTHDRVFMRAVAKKFPKTLLGLPWRVDYRIRVPASTDLDINAGRGAINLAGVEGNIRLTGTEGEANLKVSGGTLSATMAVGKLNLSIPLRSWRGVGAELRLAAGEVTIELPVGFNGDIDAEILRSGQIIDSYGGLQPRESPGITAQKMKVRAGAGGASFRLTIGDGTILIKKQQAADSKQ